MQVLLHRLRPHARHLPGQEPARPSLRPLHRLPPLARPGACAPTPPIHPSVHPCADKNNKSIPQARPPPISTTTSTIQAYAAAFGTAFNYNAYSFAGTVVAPGVISIYSTLQPLGTAVLSFLFLRSKATTGEILGGVLVVIGLFVTVAARDIEARWLKKTKGAGVVGGGSDGAGVDGREVPLVRGGDEEAGAK